MIRRINPKPQRMPRKRDPNSKRWGLSAGTKGPLQNQENYGENRDRHDLRPWKSLCKIYTVTQAAKKACPICAKGEMEQLEHIVHDD